MINLDLLLIKKRLLLLICCFCALSGITTAQTISLNAPKDSLTVGEVFNLSVAVKSSTPFDKVVFPDSKAFGENLEFLSFKHYKVSNSSDSAEFKLQYFAVEDVVISPLPIKIVTNSDTNLVFTEPVQLLYKQTIASEEDPFKPLKPNFNFPQVIWPYLLGLILLIAIALFVWWKFFRNEEVEVIEPKEIPEFQNPLLELKEILDRIKEQHTSSTEKDYKWFYSELGDALRWYIEELYKIPALESTTREVLRYMDAFGVDVELVKHTRKVLNEADMTKFAKFEPTLDASLKAFNEGLAFYERAKVVDESRIRRLKTEFENEFVKDLEEENGMG